MISQYKLRLALPDGGQLPSFWAYRLYAWLLEQLPGEAAQLLHEHGERLVSQYLNRSTWVINLFGEETAALLGEVLETAMQIDLHGDRLLVLERESHRIEGPEWFLQRGREVRTQKAELSFVSPASFKQAGRYAIFPQERLLLQSLLMRWNEACPMYPLRDADLLAEMENGIHIVDYSLRTGRFRLKSTAIPCFYGKVILEARLPVVLQELWQALLCFAPYSGVGIKTTLGMGGVEILFPERAARR